MPEQKSFVGALADFGNGDSRAALASFGDPTTSEC